VQENKHLEASHSTVIAECPSVRRLIVQCGQVTFVCIYTIIYIVAVTL